MGPNCKNIIDVCPPYSWHPFISWSIFLSSLSLKMFEYEGAIQVPMAVPLIYKKCLFLKVKLLDCKINVINWIKSLVGG